MAPRCPGRGCSLTPCPGPTSAIVVRAFVNRGSSLLGRDRGAFAMPSRDGIETCEYSSWPTPARMRRPRLESMSGDHAVGARDSAARTGCVFRIRCDGRERGPDVRDTSAHALGVCAHVFRGWSGEVETRGAAVSSGWGTLVRGETVKSCWGRGPKVHFFDRTQISEGARRHNTFLFQRPRANQTAASRPRSAAVIDRSQPTARIPPSSA